MPWIPETYLGQAAGVLTSVCWTATAFLFTAAGKRIGAMVLNTFRIWLAVLMLGLTHFLLTGLWFPQAYSGQILFLALSGLLGLTIGDLALFTALVEIGPRLSTLIMATAPLFAVLFGWLFLGETLSALAGIGIFLTVGGVVWVILERPKQKPQKETLSARTRSRGILFAFIGSACQAGGLLLSKKGMGHGWLPKEAFVSPVAASFVRMIAAGIGVLVLFAYFRYTRKQNTTTILAKETRNLGFLFAIGGTIFGPFLGMWMSLVASDLAPLGIAQTLCSLTPIFILPYLIYIQKESVSPRAIIGAIIAVLGSALLFLEPT